MHTLPKTPTGSQDTGSTVEQNAVPSTDELTPTCSDDEDFNVTVSVQDFTGAKLGRKRGDVVKGGDVVGRSLSPPGLSPEQLMVCATRIGACLCSYVSQTMHEVGETTNALRCSCRSHNYYCGLCSVTGCLGVGACTGALLGLMPLAHKITGAVFQLLRTRYSRMFCAAKPYLCDRLLYD